MQTDCLLCCMHSVLKTVKSFSILLVSQVTTAVGDSCCHVRHNLIHTTQKYNYTWTAVHWIGLFVSIVFPSSSYFLSDHFQDGRYCWSVLISSNSHKRCLVFIFFPFQLQCLRYVKEANKMKQKRMLPPRLWWCNYRVTNIMYKYL